MPSLIPRTKKPNKVRPRQRRLMDYVSVLLKVSPSSWALGLILPIFSKPFAFVLFSLLHPFPPFNQIIPMSITNICYFIKTSPDPKSLFSYHLNPPPLNSKILERILPIHIAFCHFFLQLFLTWVLSQFYFIEIVLSRSSVASKRLRLLFCLHLAWSLSSFLRPWLLLEILTLLALASTPQSAASQSHWLTPSSSSSVILDIILGYLFLLPWPSYFNYRLSSVATSVTFILANDPKSFSLVFNFPLSSRLSYLIDTNILISNRHLKPTMSSSESLSIHIHACFFHWVYIK